MSLLNYIALIMSHLNVRVQQTIEHLYYNGTVALLLDPEMFLLVGDSWRKNASRVCGLQI